MKVQADNLPSFQQPADHLVAGFKTILKGFKTTLNGFKTILKGFKMTLKGFKTILKGGIRYFVFGSGSCFTFSPSPSAGR